MKRTVSGKKSSKSNASSNKPKLIRVRISKLKSPRLRFVVCVKSSGYVDLEPLKVYRVRYDKSALATGFIRVLDESGEDYLYPLDYFQPIHAATNLFQTIEKN